jgi:hypothetical protein
VLQLFYNPIYIVKVELGKHVITKSIYA